MYKRAVSSMMLIPLFFLFTFLCIKGSKPDEIRETSRQVDSRLGIADMAASGQRVVNLGVLEQEQEYEYVLSEEELNVLQRIVESEAGSEDEDGRLLVANVVLNRVESEKFPDTVSEVVFQQEQGVTQFSPVANGRFWQVEVSEETRDAVERALKGEDISQGALYFAARKYADNGLMQWFDNDLTFLFEYGGHEFFK